MSDEFNWLHLSDLHTGLSSQGWLWPNFKTAFYEDLVRLHDKAGPWHAVIFSGDLVQSGKADEFKKLNEILDELWDRLGELGSSPILFPIPGNHDLARPDEKEPVARVLRRWWDEPSVREEFWSDASSRGHSAA